jgi:hypothetical protein
MAQTGPSPDLPTLDPLIFTLRGHRVILDADLAWLYGVTTKALNQALKRNVNRFPSDFAFQLVPAETARIRSVFVPEGRNIPENGEKTNWSQIVASSKGGMEGVPNHSLFARHDSLHRGKVYLPWAFTEHGALMAANILRSERAAEMSVYVVRAFVRLRQVMLEHEGLARRMSEVELSLRTHGEALVDIYDKLEPLLDPPEEEKPSRTLGFTSE